MDHQPPARARAADCRAAAIFDGIVDQVGDAAGKRVGLHPHRAAAAADEAHRRAQILGILGHAGEQGVDVDHRPFLARFGAAGEIQPFAHQRLHRLMITQQPIAQLAILDQFQPQPHARERRLKIMADRRQQLRALGKARPRPPLHQVEGGEGGAHFLRSPLGYLLGIEREGKGLRRALQPPQRLCHRPRDQNGESCRGDDDDEQVERVEDGAGRLGEAREAQRHGPSRAMPVGEAHHPAVWPGRVDDAGGAFLVAAAGEAEPGGHLPRFGLRRCAEPLRQDGFQLTVRIAQRDAGRRHRRPDDAVIGHHRFHPGRVALQPVRDVDRARHHAGAADAFEIMMPRLFGDQQRDDRRDRHAKRQDEEDLPRHRPEKGADACQRLQSRHRCSTPLAST